jgi:hypothetical protein
MPTPASPGTNRLRCEACGRHFNTQEEFERHHRECAAVKNTGSAAERQSQGADHDEGDDREWVSTP